MINAHSFEEMILQAKFSGYMPQIQQAIATRQIITATANTLGIEVSASELQQAADRFRLTQHLKDANATWQWLEHHGLSLEEFEAMISHTLLQQKVSDQLFTDQIEPYFLQHQHTWSQAAIYEIIFDDEDVAIEYFYAIQQRELTFFDVAQIYIIDPEARRKGGYQGYLPRQAFVPSLEAAIFGAVPPQLLKPKTTAKGIHLIQVEDITEPPLTPELKTEIQLQLFKTWIEQQLKQER